MGRGRPTSTLTKRQAAVKATDQPAPQPTPAPHPTAPIPPAEAASRYRQAAAHYRDLAATADYEGCEYVRDEMTMCYCQLAAAGRLDLIGASA